MTESMLNEYVRITRIIENIHNKITRYQIKTEKLIKNAKYDEERRVILDRFNKIMYDIKHDKDINVKYKILRDRQIELKSKLIRQDSIDETIGNIKMKYINSMSNDELTKKLTSYDQIDTILDNIKSKINNLPIFIHERI